MCYIRENILTFGQVEVILFHLYEVIKAFSHIKFKKKEKINFI